MIRYKASIYPSKIKKIEIERESEHCVWIKGERGRKVKRTSVYGYFHNHGMAKMFLQTIARDRVDDCKVRLGHAERELEKVNELGEGL